MDDNFLPVVLGSEKSLCKTLLKRLIEKGVVTSNHGKRMISLLETPQMCANCLWFYDL